MIQNNEGFWNDYFDDLKSIYREPSQLFEDYESSEKMEDFLACFGDSLLVAGIITKLPEFYGFAAGSYSGVSFKESREHKQAEDLIYRRLVPWHRYFMKRGNNEEDKVREEKERKPSDFIEETLEPPQEE